MSTLTVYWRKCLKDYWVWFVCSVSVFPAAVWWIHHNTGFGVYGVGIVLLAAILAQFFAIALWEFIAHIGTTSFKLCWSATTDFLWTLLIVMVVSAVYGCIATGLAWVIGWLSRLICTILSIAVSQMSIDLWVHVGIVVLMAVVLPLVLNSFFGTMEDAMSDCDRVGHHFVS